MKLQTLFLQTKHIYNFVQSEIVEPWFVLWIIVRTGLHEIAVIGFTISVRNRLILIWCVHSTVCIIIILARYNVTCLWTAAGI